jgi:hypothetical protein
MLKKSGLVLAAAVAGTMFASGTGWSAQPLTPTQARDLSKLKTVALLVAVPEKLFVSGPKAVCSEVEALGGWSFKTEVENHLVAALSPRFTLVPKTYDGEELVKLDFGQLPRRALPPGDDIDAYVVFWGAVAFRHPAGMPFDRSAYGSQLGALPYLMSEVYAPALNRHDPELQYAAITVDVISAKTKRTIARKEMQAGPYESTFGPHLHVSGLGSKEREEKDWLCAGPLTEEKIAQMREDYRVMVKEVLDATLQLLRWAPAADKKQ